MLVPLHHHLELFVDLRVFGFGAGREIIFDRIGLRTLWRHGTLMLLLVECLDDILVGEGLVGFVVLGVLEKNLVHVGACILIQLVARTEDNQGNLAVAEYRQFVRLLHYPEFPLVKGHLTIPFVRDARNLNLLPTHFCTTLWRRDSSSEPLDGI